MAQIDASIPLGVKQFQMPDQIGQAGKLYQLKSLQMGYEDDQRKQQQQALFQQAAQGIDITTPDGMSEYTKRVTAISPEMGLKLQEFSLGAESKRAGIRKDNLEAHSKGLDMLYGAVFPAAQLYITKTQEGVKPEIAHQMANTVYQQSIAGLKGILPDEELSMLPQQFDPDTVIPFAAKTKEWKDLKDSQMKEREFGLKEGHYASQEGNDARRTSAYEHNINSMIARRGELGTEGTTPRIPHNAKAPTGYEWNPDDPGTLRPIKGGPKDVSATPVKTPAATVKAQTEAATKTAETDELIDSIDQAIKNIDENPEVVGTTGKVMRPLETIAGIAGQTDETPASDFETNINTVKQQYRKHNNAKGTRLKRDVELEDSIVKGLGTLTSPQQARSALVKLKSRLESEKGGGVVSVSSPDDAAKLPVGTKFRTPDGRILERH